MKEEIWKAIPGYEGLYEASNLGNLRRSKRIIPDTYLICKITPEKPINMPDSDTKVILTNWDGSTKSFRSEYLVALTFLPRSKCKHVNFKDSNRYNREVNNLEWSKTPFKCIYGKPKRVYSVSEG